MANNNIVERSCWFYDNQMLDRMTCVSLHANTYQTKKDENSSKLIWRKYTASDNVDSGGYSIEPLCTSILSEDFQVNISNDWQQVNAGSDFVKSTWDRLRVTAPYTKKIEEIIGNMGKEAEDWSKTKTRGGFSNVIAKGMASFSKTVSEIGDDAVDYLNSSLIAQGTRFKYYSGTGVSFGNLQMRFTMFPIWTAEGTFLTVPQQLERLFPYVMGSYSDFAIGTKEVEVKVGEGDEAKTTKVQMEDTIKLLGWQKPPAGFQADMHDIDQSGIKGTLKLRIGAFYVLESIICESISFNLSRQMVKRPEETSWAKLENSINVNDQMAFSPLFADVTLAFSPATNYSDRAMRRFIYGLNIGGKEMINEGGREVSNQMKENLKRERENLESIYTSSGNV